MHGLTPPVRQMIVIRKLKDILGNTSLTKYIKISS